MHDRNAAAGKIFPFRYLGDRGWELASKGVWKKAKFNWMLAFMRTTVNYSTDTAQNCNATHS